MHCLPRTRAKCGCTVKTGEPVSQSTDSMWPEGGTQGLWQCFVVRKEVWVSFAEDRYQLWGASGGVRVLGHGFTDPRASGSCSGLGSTLCSPTPVHSWAAVQTLPFAFWLSEIKWEKVLFSAFWTPRVSCLALSYLPCHVGFTTLRPWYWEVGTLLLLLGQKHWELVFPGRKEMFGDGGQRRPRIL